MQTLFFFISQPAAVPGKVLRLSHLPLLQPGMSQLWSCSTLQRLSRLEFAFLLCLTQVAAAHSGLVSELSFALSEVGMEALVDKGAR